jgi:hypothetical protein
MMDAHNLAEQTSIRVNEHSRRGKFGFSVCPSLARASVAREQKQQPPTPALAPVDAALASGDIFAPIDVTCYAEALGPIRERIGSVLKITYANFDKLACFPEGLTGKVMGRSQVRRLGIEKFFDALRGAGLRIRLEEDPEQTEKMLNRIAQNYPPRQANQARLGNSANLSNKFIDSVLDYLTNKKGGLARLNKAVKEARANVARRASIAGWARKRELQRFGNFAACSEAYLGNVSQPSTRLSLPPPLQETAPQPCSAERHNLATGNARLIGVG